MCFKFVRHLVSAMTLGLLLAGCGGRGGPAPAPTGGATAVPGESQVTINWSADPGVEYWLWYVAGNSISSTNPTTTPGHFAVLNVSPPYVLSGLVNGTTYSFTVNGRISGGPGGPGTPSVSAVPRPAGVIWTAGGAIGSGDMHGVTYGTMTNTLSTYVAVGNAGAIYTSADALTWAVATSGTGLALDATLFTLNQFIAVGATGTILTSADTVTWTAATSNTTQNLNAIASNGGLAVAVGDAGTIRYSTDGATWTAAASVPTGNNLNGVMYNGIWVAVGAGGTVLTSADGSNWAAATSGTTNALNAVSYRAATTILGVAYPAVYVAVGANTILTSADAVTWSSQTVGGATLLALYPLASQFLAVGASGAAYTSADAVTWTSRSTGTSANLYGLTWAQAQYVAVGTGGVSRISK